MSTAVIIPAGGTGTRMGAAVPKQFLKINGTSIIAKTIRVFLNSPAISKIVIATEESSQYMLEEILKELYPRIPVFLVKGGTTRQESVLNALQSEHMEDVELVLVHDAVRPFVSPMLIQKLISELREFDGAVPGLRPKETIKESDGLCVASTLNRDSLISVQTPQAFRKDLLLKANMKASATLNQLTDDASIAEMNGLKIRVVEGEEFNIKITTNYDLALAEFIDRQIMKVKI